MSTAVKSDLFRGLEVSNDATAQEQLIPLEAEFNRLTEEKETRTTERARCEQHKRDLAKTERELQRRSVALNAEINLMETAIFDILAKDANAHKFEFTQLSNKREVQRLVDGTNSYIVANLLPDAQDAALVAVLAQMETDLSWAEVAAKLSFVRTIIALGPAFEEEGRLAVIGERTRTCIELAEKARYQRDQAKTELVEYRKNQETLRAQKIAAGLVTRAR